MGIEEEGFPQHYAAASLKPSRGWTLSTACIGFPQHYAAASLKPCRFTSGGWGERMFSAALRCGLIEALQCPAEPLQFFRFPQHYAAASLKHRLRANANSEHSGFSAALRCGLIEAASATRVHSLQRRFSAALRCGLIEAFSWGLFLGVEFDVFRSITLRPH